MSDYASQVLAAQPTIEEWLDVAEPGLKKAVLAMFRSVKEISYKIRTTSFGTRVKRVMSCSLQHYIYPRVIYSLNSLWDQTDFSPPTIYLQGDEELAVDIVANNVIFQNLKNCGSVATASSAEAPTEGKKF